MNRVDIRIDGAEAGHFELREIRAAHSLAGHILIFDVLWHLRGHPQELPLSLHDFRGTLSASAEDGDVHYIGHLFPPETVPGFVVPTHEGDHSMRFSCLVDAHTVEILERRRNGGPIILQLMIGCVSTVQGRAGSVTACVRENLSKHRWAELLEGAGYGAETWIAVPAIPDTATGPLKSASQQLASAKRKLAGGDWVGSLTQCRMLSESLLEVYPKPTANGDSTSNRPNAKQRVDRIRELAQCLRNLAGGAVHADVIASGEWRRADAGLAVRLAASLLAHAIETGL